MHIVEVFWTVLCFLIIYFSQQLNFYLWISYKSIYLLWCKYSIYLDRVVQYMWQRAERIKLEWKSCWELCVGVWTLHLCKDRVGESTSLSFSSQILHNRPVPYILAYALGVDFCPKPALISSIWVLRYLGNLQLKWLIKEVLQIIMI